MRVWRICRQAWARAAFEGDGARQTGGRWNHKGDAVVYTSATLSLASLELFVHLDPEEMPEDLVSIYFDIPSNIKTLQITESELPRNWREYPAPAALKDIGSDWIRSGKTLLLVVPSAMIPQETNVLINPFHKDFSKCKMSKSEPFHFDPRMWKMQL